MRRKRFFASYHFLWEEMGFVLPIHPTPVSLQVGRAGGATASTPSSARLSALLQAPLTHEGGCSSALINCPV